MSTDEYQKSWSDEIVGFWSVSEAGEAAWKAMSIAQIGSDRNGNGGARKAPNWKSLSLKFLNFNASIRLQSGEVQSLTPKYSCRGSMWDLVSGSLQKYLSCTVTFDSFFFFC